MENFMQVYRGIVYRQHSKPQSPLTYFKCDSMRLGHIVVGFQRACFSMFAKVLMRMTNITFFLRSAKLAMLS